MNVEHLRHMVSRAEFFMDENRLTTVMIAIALLVALVVFGGLVINWYIDYKQERQKLKAVERLHKYLETSPGSKS